MIQKKLKIYAALFLFTAILPSVVTSQSAFLDREQTGKGVDFRLVMKGFGFDNLGISAGYSINGFVDLGVDLGMYFGKLGGQNSTEFRASIIYAFSVLKQDRVMPISLMILGSFGKTKVVSDYLDSGNLIKSGTGYSIGTDIYRYFFLAPRWFLRAGTTVFYESCTYITEDPAGTIPGYPLAQPAYNIFYGLLAGVSYRPNRAMALSLNMKLYLDKDLKIRLGSIISITSSEDSI